MDTPDKAQDLAYLKAKVDCGVDFIVTQLFDDVDTFLEWAKACREMGQFSLGNWIPNLNGEEEN